MEVTRSGRKTGRYHWKAGNKGTERRRDLGQPAKSTRSVLCRASRKKLDGKGRTRRDETRRDETRVEAKERASEGGSGGGRGAAAGGEARRRWKLKVALECSCR